jgi:hypothetical protein
MAGRFQWTSFSDVNLHDQFFDSLKNDYKGFAIWYEKKSREGRKALVFNDEIGVGAFLCLKDENEPIELKNRILPANPRVKISTLRLAERFRGQRFGEGALGIALWDWKSKQVPEIYVTIFEKHGELIRLFERFGFKNIGINQNNECVYLKSRESLDYSDPYRAFPFIRPDFTTAGIIPIDDDFHDQLFPYSELKGNHLEIEEETAGNGITKIFIGAPYSAIHYVENEPVLIYRIFNGNGPKTYHSVVTSFCTVTKSRIIKNRGSANMELEEFLSLAGNKTVFNLDELRTIYSRKQNIVLLEMVYNGYFGKGHNVIHKQLNDLGLFPSHPYNITYTKEEFCKILEMGDVDVQNVIVD